MGSRRNLLKTLVVLPAGIGAAQTAAQTQHPHDQASPTKPKPAQTGTTAPAEPKAFNAEQFELLTALAGIIIPKTETPGAIEAGAPMIIDGNAAASATLKTSLTKGLAELNSAAMKAHSKAFISLPASDQTALLTAISKETQTSLGRFFKVMRDQTIDAYYSTPQGLVEELGYSGRAYLTKFTGCTHPEHQV